MWGRWTPLRSTSWPYIFMLHHNMRVGRVVLLEKWQRGGYAGNLGTCRRYATSAGLDSTLVQETWVFSNPATRCGIQAREEAFGINGIMAELTVYIRLRISPRTAIALILWLAQV